MNQSSDFKFDVRIQQRMLAGGQLTHKELESRLATLPDGATQSLPLGIAAPGVGACLGGDPAATAAAAAPAAVVFSSGETRA
jgi:hypothetical protein